MDNLMTFYKIGVKVNENGYANLSEPIKLCDMTYMS